ncbi:MAG: serine/threonine-protein kinase [Pyrinomonadaceae bacterium]
MDVPHIIAGRFRIECEIGTGGMGTVYRATQLGLERTVAVKIIKPEYASDPDVADRFMREARTMARLRHAHATMIFEAGNLPDGRHFIVMEHVEGKTLSETLTTDGWFAPARAVEIASDICDVLAEAHKLGIVHRDLKPSNIMLNERGVCVLDFGVAKVLATSADATATHATTGSGVIVGTPRYMSPEQCLGQSVEARSDIYSLGVLVYEMLAGRPPFIDALQSAVLVKQASVPPPPLPKLRADVPRPLAVAVHTLLAKRPEDRPPTADAARKLLQRSLAQTMREAPSTQPFASTLVALDAGRSLFFRAVTPLILVLAFGMLLFVWGRGGVLSTSEAASVPDAIKQTQSAATLNAQQESLKAQQSNPIPVATENASFNMSNESVTSASTPRLFSSSSSAEEMRSIVGSMLHGVMSDVRVMRTPREPAIVALKDGHRRGTSHLFVLERVGGKYGVIARAALDAEKFRGALWSVENVDADGDGYDEVLYTGTKPRGRESDCRLVLYVPRTRQTYALRVENGLRGRGPTRTTISSNSLSTSAAPYRTILQQRARKGFASL